MKKLLQSIGMIAISMSPIVIALSCNKNTSKPSVEDETKNETPDNENKELEISEILKDFPLLDQTLKPSIGEGQVLLNETSYQYYANTIGSGRTSLMNKAWQEITKRADTIENFIKMIALCAYQDSIDEFGMTETLARVRNNVTGSSEVIEDSRDIKGGWLISQANALQKNIVFWDGKIIYETSRDFTWDQIDKITVTNPAEIQDGEISFNDIETYVPQTGTIGSSATEKIKENWTNLTANVKSLQGFYNGIGQIAYNANGVFPHNGSGKTNGEKWLKNYANSISKDIVFKNGEKIECSKGTWSEIDDPSKADATIVIGAHDIKFDANFVNYEFIEGAIPDTHTAKIQADWANIKANVYSKQGLINGIGQSVYNANWAFPFTGNGKAAIESWLQYLANKKQKNIIFANGDKISFVDINTVVNKHISEFEFEFLFQIGATTITVSNARAAAIYAQWNKTRYDLFNGTLVKKTVSGNEVDCVDASSFTGLTLPDLPYPDGVMKNLGWGTTTQALLRISKPIVEANSKEEFIQLFNSAGGYSQSVSNGKNFIDALIKKYESQYTITFGTQPSTSSLESVYNI